MLSSKKLNSINDERKVISIFVSFDLYFLLTFTRMIIQFIIQNFLIYFEKDILLHLHKMTLSY